MCPHPVLCPFVTPSHWCAEVSQARTFLFLLPDFVCTCPLAVCLQWSADSPPLPGPTWFPAKLTSAHFLGPNLAIIPSKNGHRPLWLGGWHSLVLPKHLTCSVLALSIPYRAGAFPHSPLARSSLRGKMLVVMSPAWTGTQQSSVEMCQPIKRISEKNLQMY